MTDGAVLSEIAVLVRAGFQTREFEDRFISIGLPYRVVGTRFYERTEIRDSVAYLRLVAQPIDDLAFERVINNPKRGLGLATMRIIYMHARASNKSLFSAAKDIESSDEIRPSAKKITFSIFKRCNVLGRDGWKYSSL